MIGKWNRLTHRTLTEFQEHCPHNKLEQMTTQHTAYSSPGLLFSIFSGRNSNSRRPNDQKVVQNQHFSLQVKLLLSALLYIGGHIPRRVPGTFPRRFRQGSDTGQAAVERTLALWKDRPLVSWEFLFKGATPDLRSRMVKKSSEISTFPPSVTRWSAGTEGPRSQRSASNNLKFCTRSGLAQDFL